MGHLMGFHEHDAAGCIDCDCAATLVAPRVPCTCPPRPFPGEIWDLSDYERGWNACLRQMNRSEGGVDA